jgi:hypothetical protein
MKTEQKVFRGKVTGIGFIYDDKDYFQKIGVEFRFKSGSIQYLTNKASLFVSSGDILHFTIKIVEDRMWIDEIIKVEKTPMKKVTFKERQSNRLFESM